MPDFRRLLDRVPRGGLRSPDGARRLQLRAPGGIERGPLVAALIVLGVPAAVLIALIAGSEGVRLGGLVFATLVFGTFLWGFFYEVRRLTLLP